MEPADLLRKIADTFDSLHLPYLITGSTATIVYGEPRFTNDIDVVLDLPLAKVDALLAAFPATEYYVSRAAVEMAIRDPGMFKIIHPATGLEVDVMVSSDSEFDRMRLSRGRCCPIGRCGSPPLKT